MWRTEVARGVKTAEDQGVPWMKTRVCGGVVGGSVWVDVEESKAYLISQLSWWKVDGRGIGVGVVVLRLVIVLEDRRFSMSPLYCLRVVELVFLFATRSNCDGIRWLIYRFACCALIGQFEFKCYVNWSSRSTCACKHTSHLCTRVSTAR